MKIFLSIIFCLLLGFSLRYVNDYIGHPWDYLYNAFVIFAFIFMPLLWHLIKYKKSN